ncbi:transcriptional regulator [Actinomadura graeca]|uniref:Transcriptional regulator n=1 Tax=Actinomadura graeca TaxID=2750812 RepID=A0ABX8R7W0_9ACTN|nr:transcriptional regulator [Actinomadura graeca]
MGARLRQVREAPPYWSRAELARLLRAAADPRDRANMPHVPSLIEMIKQWEAGRHLPNPRYRALYARVTGRSEAELFGAEPARASPWRPGGPGENFASDDEREALELARRVAASDVGDETLVALEMTVDELASDYPRSPPDELLARIRRHLRYVSQLMDARMTLDARRRLVVVGGWLSLLAATCDIDRGHRPPAAAHLRTAAQLAQHGGHIEILAWTLETAAWQLLTEGEYRKAVMLARQAQDVAPRDGSAFIQATAQEGRAWARLGDGPETRRALARVERLVAPLPMPDRPEHHYRYDPAKSDAYQATTLSWLGDPAAVPLARGVLDRLERPAAGPARPRRAASARLDLALALLTAEQADEAAQRALEAMGSGRLVPSNHWRAAEVVTAVEALGLPEAADLNEAFRELCASAER